MSCSHVDVTILVIAAILYMPGTGCGGQKRESGGMPAEDNEFPWLVLLQVSDIFPFCGGALIDQQWVITAAHCFHPHPVVWQNIQGNNSPDNVMQNILETDSTANVRIPGQIVTVNAGNRMRSKYESDKEWRQKIGVSSVIEHEGYNSTTLDNDVALIKLNMPLNMNSHVKKIAVSDVSPDKNQSCKFSGYGVAKGMETAAELQKTLLPAVDENMCKGNMENRICTQGKGLCLFDSGSGPLVCESNGAWKLHGIASTVTPLEKCGSNKGDFDFIFMDISKYKEWIKQKTGLDL